VGKTEKVTKKEPPKVWGKKERLFVLIILFGTALISGLLALSSRDYKLPGLPRLKLTIPSFSLPKGETITIGSKVDQSARINAKKEKQISEAFNQITKDLSGVYAFYLIDLKSGHAFGTGEGDVMQAASLIKLPLMLYAYGKVDDAKIEAMGKRSDNTVFWELVAKFGEATVQDYISNLGMKNTSLEENETTPKEIGDLFAKLYQEKEEKILTYLTDTVFEDWLAKGVPEEIRVAHKYGREVHVVNDAGIIFAKDPFVLVVMTEGIVEKEADATIPELTGMIYRKMVE